jgi:hypothetical protein
VISDLPVTQADRDRAAVYHHGKHGGRILAGNIREGYVDHDPVVQMLAAHRLATLKAVGA